MKTPGKKWIILAFVSLFWAVLYSTPQNDSAASSVSAAEASDLLQNPGLFTPVSQTPRRQTVDPLLVQKLAEASDSQAEISYHRVTGMASFIKLPAGRGLTLEGATPAEKADSFFRDYGGLFGIINSDQELSFIEQKDDDLGFTRLTYQQLFQGVPVFGGILRVHLDAAGDISAVNGLFIPSINLDTIPVLSPDSAGLEAIAAVNKQLSYVPEVPLVAQNYALTIFRQGLLQGYENMANSLVYEITVGNGNGIREFVYVDAHDGAIVEQFSGVYHDDDERAPLALNRETRDQNMTRAYPAVGDGVLCWNESGQQGTYNAGCELAHIYAGHVYNMYLNGFNRDSLDDAGMTLYSAVDMCPPLLEGPCPYGNAYWDGSLMAYGNSGGSSLAELDDVVSHELSHGVTEFTSNLIYAWQTGAINEAFSDVMGESLDILNGTGLGDGSIDTLRTTCNNSTRWDMGENFFVIRDMWQPSCEGDPDKVIDGNYVCSTADSGGVHTNSGVVNHAYAILVDGKTFNGQTVTGIGLTKAMHIYYRANAVYLTNTSDFTNLADALGQSCTDLIGVNLQDPDPNGGGGASGEIISSGDCAEVAKASLAVELRSEPSQCGFTPMLDASQEICTSGGVTTNPLDIMFEDFESVSAPALPAGWSTGTRDESGTFTARSWESTASAPGSNSSQAAFGTDPVIGDCAGQDESGVIQLFSPATVIPAGTGAVHLSFDHYVSTEMDWDGGNLRYRINGGAWTAFSSGDFLFNGYPGSLETAGSGNTNPLAGQAAYHGADGGSVQGSWGTTSIDLTPYVSASDTVEVVWELGTDGCNGQDGWYLDNVRIHDCGNCGNSALDVADGETCDDGNPYDGDGCSSTCTVETGYENCTAPVPGSNVITDGSFEGGTPNAAWTESSTNFGTPICDNATCGGPPPEPSDGTYWARLGGVDANETAYVEQSLPISSGSSDLTFDLWAENCGNDANDFFRITVDGNTEYNVTSGNTLCGASGYSQETIDLSAYADGSNHTVRFAGRNKKSGPPGTPYLTVHLDDIFMGGPNQPSVCTTYTADYSDLTGDYTLAWHEEGGGRTIWIGTSVTNDGPAGTLPDLGDDNSSDDGVSRTNSWVTSGTATVTVEINGSAGGWLAAWVDWGNNGSFSDAGELVLDQAVALGSHDLSFPIPAGYTTGSSVNTRFRVYASEPLLPVRAAAPDNGALDGEVEDYAWSFGPTAITLQTVTTHGQPDIGVALAALAALLLGLFSWRFWLRRQDAF